MTGEPIIDGRDREDLLAELTELADQYVEDWDPHTPDNGRTLLRVFSQFGAEVIQRLDSVPAKHRLAFLDALGFSQHPPEAASVPVSFAVSDDLDSNVTIPGGTQVVADTDEESTTVFETPAEAGFEATSADLETVFGVDPAADAIVDHSELADGNATTLFTGENCQDHSLYLGHESLLTLSGGSTITVRIETVDAAGVFRDHVEWEYYGTDETGTEGWHELPPLEAVDPAELGDEPDRIDRLQQEIASLTQDEPGGSDEVFEASFLVEGEPVSETMGGIESRWLRCRLTGSEGVAVEIESASLTVNETDDGSTPDRLFANDVPLSTDGDGDVAPFGQLPQPPTTCYIAAQEAFSKPGAVVELAFEPPVNSDAVTDGVEDTSDETAGPVGGPPEISWEYYDGSGWSRLDVTDGTNTLREAGTVTFVVPPDLTTTAVSGHETTWVRARLVGGNYGRPSVDVTESGQRGTVDQPSPPEFGSITVSYADASEQFEHVLASNNRVISDDLADADTITPFVGLTETEQTLYLGFDEPLRNGPLALFVPVADTTYPGPFDPGLTWEYDDPDTEAWQQLTVTDETDGLTERGVVMVTLPGETTATERFGRRHHWLRARVTRDAFDTSEETEDHSEGPPVLEGIYPNTQWADNARRIDGEVLGSSDGSPDQQFACAHDPVLDIEVWVDEHATLSASDRRQLRADRQAAVEQVTDSTDTVEAFWVRWTERANLVGAGPDARTYVVDETAGEIRFGDDEHGAIPPSGKENIRATYRTGGGEDGNVDQGAVTDLKSSISLVDSVTNPEPAAGGQPVESTTDLRSRATGQIRHRGRAVSPRDFEGIARTAGRKVAAVTCEPGLDADGGHDPGLVTVVIVPDSQRAKPVPSVELTQRVQKTLTERAPATLTERPSGGVLVRGPRYATVSVTVTVRADGVESVSVLTDTITDRLDRYLHPLSGGPDGDGWAFGALPTLDGLTDHVTEAAGVEAVREIRMQVTASEEEWTVTPGSRPPGLDPDMLVCAGEQDVSVTTGEQR